MVIKEIILLKDGEIALKGLNRSTFEDRLIRNAKQVLNGLGTFKFVKSQSTIVVRPDDTVDVDEAFERLKKLFGVISLSRACVAPKDFAEICEYAKEYLADVLPEFDTFKVNAKRSDKKFPMKSPEICAELGGVLLDAFPHLSVDVNNPQVTVTVEIRDESAYIHTDATEGAGGIPVGTGGRAALLLSGGIDSPVAGYMMAKRGVELVGVHFESPPYTSERAKLKVIKLAEKLCDYSIGVALFVIPFTKMQERIKESCPEELFTVIMRRYMMRVANKLAEKQDCGALITGESLGQVASQTLQAIKCTDTVSELPVLRPLIGMDKKEIIAIAKKIDTFDTSILPYEDCCTVFTPKHPRTKPTIPVIEGAESYLEDAEELVNECVENAELIIVGNPGRRNNR